MDTKRFYSTRVLAKEVDVEICLNALKRIVLDKYRILNEQGYFQKYFGTNCQDEFIIGKLGRDIEAILVFKLNKKYLYPIDPKLLEYTEVDLFDILEFLHEYCSKGLDEYRHGFNNSCIHFKKYDDSDGQKYFREIINPFLRDYKDGFEISVKGEILNLSPIGLSTLLNAKIPTNDKANIEDRINESILKFRKSRSSYSDRKDAILELASVFEFLRQNLKGHLDKADENDLFNIANNFAIRHHNNKQKQDYDKAIWYSWMFYFYLATIHTTLRLIDKSEKNSDIANSNK